MINVGLGLIALTAISLVGIGIVKTDNSSVVLIASGAFGVNGTIVATSA